MDLLSKIKDLAKTPAMAGIAISSVRVVTLKEPGHSARLIVRWTMPDASMSDLVCGTRCEIFSAPDNTVIDLGKQWISKQDFQDAIVKAAWETGAFDVSCFVFGQRGPDHLSATLNDWGVSQYSLNGSHGPADIDQQIVDAAQRDGYRVWTFKPASLGVPLFKKHWQRLDSTLQADCSRSGACASMPKIGKHTTHLGGSQKIIRLGHK